MSKLIISCDDKEAEIMASIDRTILDHLPTDQKYCRSMEEALIFSSGYGFVSKEEEENYLIPDYITDEDVAVWQAEKVIYDSSSKQYILKK